MRETALIENFFVTQFLEKLLTLVQKQSFKFTLVELERQKYVNEFGNNLPICKIRVQSIMINQVKNTINQLIFQVYLLYVFFHEFQTYQPEWWIADWWQISNHWSNKAGLSIIVPQSFIFISSIHVLCTNQVSSFKIQKDILNTLHLQTEFNPVILQHLQVGKISYNGLSFSISIVFRISSFINLHLARLRTTLRFLDPLIQLINLPIDEFVEL